MFSKFLNVLFIISVIMLYMFGICLLCVVGHNIFQFSIEIKLYEFLILIFFGILCVFASFKFMSYGLKELLWIGV